MFPRHSFFFILFGIMGIFMSSLSLFIFILFNRAKLTGTIRLYLALLLASYCIMLLDSAINMYSIPNRYDVTYVFLDLGTMVLSLSGLTLHNSPPGTLKRYLLFLGIVGVVCGLISLSLSDFSAGAIINRDMNTWKPQYVLWFTLFPWPFLLIYKIVYRKELGPLMSTIAVLCTFLYFALGMLFQKRIILLEILFMGCIYIILNRDHLTRVAKAISMALVVCIIMASILASVLHFDIIQSIEGTIARTKGESFKGFDRFVEFKDLFSQFSGSFLLVGTGLGSNQTGPGRGNVHIGWLNFIFKGGFVLLASQVFVFFIALRSLFKASSRRERYLSACIVFYYLTLVVSSTWIIRPVESIFSILIFSFLFEHDSRRMNGQSEMSKTGDDTRHALAG